MYAIRSYYVSQHTHFPRGQGLPGGVWAAQTPILMRDLGAGYRFIRADSAGKAGLTVAIPTLVVYNYYITRVENIGDPPGGDQQLRLR